MKFWQHPMFWIAVVAVGLSIGIFENSACGGDSRCFKESYVTLLAMGLFAVGFAMTIVTIPQEWRRHDS
jgi:hypothetical protein